MNRFLTPFLLLIFQSFLLALVGAGISLELYEMVEKATRHSGLTELHRTVKQSAPIFLFLAAVAWLFGEAALIRSSFKINSVPSNSDFMNVLAPIHLFMFFGLAVLLVGAAGLLVAMAAHLALSELMSCEIGAAVFVGLAAWMIRRARSITPIRHGNA